MCVSQYPSFTIKSLVKCPICEGPLNIDTSSAISLTYFKGHLVCCNPRCRDFECDFEIILSNFKRSLGMRDAHEIATWTASEKSRKNIDPRQIQIETD